MNRLLGTTKPVSYHEWLVKMEKPHVRKDNLNLFGEYSAKVFGPNVGRHLSTFTPWPSPEDFDRELCIDGETGWVSFPRFYDPEVPRRLKFKQPLIRSMARAQLGA